MRMPPLPADSIHARACKLKCEKILTRPHETAINLATEFSVSERTIRNDLVILSCYYPIQVTWGRYGGVAHLPEWFHLENRMLSPKQEILLQKLKTALDGEELQVMNSILAQFALYWEYR